MQRGTCVTSILACYHAGLLYIIQSLHSSMLNCHIRLSSCHNTAAWKIHAESDVLPARDSLPCSCAVDFSVAVSVQAMSEFKRYSSIANAG